MISYLIICTAIALGFTFAVVKGFGPATDVPNSRSSHAQPTPKGAGFALSLAGLVYLALFDWSVVSSVATAMLLLGLLGLIDDRRGITPGWRLLWELMIAVGICSQGLVWQLPFTWLPESIYQPMCWAFTVLWILWGINYFNFMDGINGIALTHAIIVGLFYALLLPADAGVLMWGCIAAMLCILPFNFPKARTFLGDSGSLPIGGLITIAPLLAQQSIGPETFQFWHAIIAVWPFFMDALTVLLRRIIARESITQAHCSHSYQILARHLQSHTMVTLLYGAISALILSDLYLYLVAENLSSIWLMAMVALTSLCGAAFLQFTYYHTSSDPSRS